MDKNKLSEDWVLANQGTESQDVESNAEDKHVNIKDGKSDDTAAEQHLLLSEEIAKLKDQLLRSLAENENLRRRSEKERDEAARYAIVQFSRDLLSTSDNLSRAFEAIDKEPQEFEGSIKQFVEGVKLTERELSNTLEKHGIKKTAGDGEKFNPNLHQAMFESESSTHESGTIIRVLQAGYTIYDRLLRPALVEVAKAVD